ncbi:hypothetical protein [Silvibacterium dinghuense]|uniref:Transmembrane protein n=1 Tax=Silvibacterium dinghuense TaxID=1560006 RepID=A0A4Q1SKE7_9BACT|nr:hypothetical protein [Silvibacterium dinghuense]RXS97933.1 hypothetical protein ESZ00_08780 [Silvibacterium dinghuense]
MVFRRRVKAFPFFTCLVGFDALQSIVLLLASTRPRLYNGLYWGGQVVDLLLQLAVVVEIARQVFRPFGRWAKDARAFWIAVSSVCFVLALGMVFLAQPQAPDSAWAWVLRGDLFAVMLTCMVSVAVLVTARRYGLSWRNHVMGLAQGWTFWAFITFVVETCHSYWGYGDVYFSLFYVGALAGVLAQAYWMFVFWRDEPTREMTPEMRQILVERQRELDYYVGKLVHRPHTRRSS